MIKKTRWFVSSNRRMEDGLLWLRNSKGSTYWFSPEGLWLTGHNKRRVTSHAVIARLERAMATAIRKEA
jgi:hypothetical protein